MAENIATRTVIMRHPTGLCLRGASAIARLARRYESQIQIIKDSRQAPASEALQIAALGVEAGTQLALVANGPDADEALDALVKLFADNFGLGE